LEPELEVGVGVGTVNGMVVSGKGLFAGVAIVRVNQLGMEFAGEFETDCATVVAAPAGAPLWSAVVHEIETLTKIETEVEGEVPIELELETGVEFGLVLPSSWSHVYL
jgi:hypothetical protein